MDEPRVLFVSKPIVPPWHDGSKNLVRDVATHLTHARPTVFVTPGAERLGPRVTIEPIYRDAGRFAPGLVANARVVGRLLTGDPHDAWHFVFAPNAASSSAAIFARRVQRTLGWRGPVVQTVASAPREFDGVARWIFGDAVVALSQWMRGRLIGAGVRADAIRVIPPCAAAPIAPSAERIANIRALIDVDADAPIVLFPGDYEVSRGAETMADATAAIARAIPEVRVVFACRPKTQNAAAARAAIEAKLAASHLTSHVRHAGEVADMHALLAAARVVAFPVDDLYGKVDLPLVLLESLALGIPMVLARGGPLEAIDAARFVDPSNAEALANEVIALLQNAGDLPERAKAAYAARYTPGIVAAQYDALYREVT
jgi:glycosyltransferase involved in cell wall biosynthesis